MDFSLKDEAVALDIPFLREMPIAPRPKAFSPKDVTQLQTLRQRSHEALAQAGDWLRHEFDLERPASLLLKTVDRDADTFVSALRDAIPKKRKLTAADIAALKREYSATLGPAKKARAEIFRLEQKLSGLVNTAYGLSPKEVELLWQTAPPRMPFTPSGLALVERHDESDEDEE